MKYTSDWGGIRRPDGTRVTKKHGVFDEATLEEINALLVRTEAAEGKLDDLRKENEQLRLALGALISLQWDTEKAMDLGKKEILRRICLIIQAIPTELEEQEEDDGLVSHHPFFNKDGLMSQTYELQVLVSTKRRGL